MKELLKTIIFSKHFVVLAAIIIGLLSAYFWYQDNPVEEISEEVIEEQTGINIDLSPETPEKESEDKLSYFPKYIRWH
ncbi:hypothetical protein Megpolyxen_01396 [Candidatus Megaera polyxenophila]|nr:hypothetical protein Megpolyxen_01396 [Candidatus Megaera polyxenophila]